MVHIPNYNPVTRRRLRHNKLHGITPRVAKAASVGDSILESINMNDATTQGERIDEGVGIRDPSDLSWAGHALPPDQVLGSSWFLCNDYWTILTPYVYCAIVSLDH